MNTHKFRKLNVWQRSVEFVRFLRMAQRSAYAVIAALEIAINLRLTDKSVLDEAISEVDQLSAMISGLIKSLKADS